MLFSFRRSVRAGRPHITVTTPLITRRMSRRRSRLPYRGTLKLLRAASNAESFLRNVALKLRAISHWLCTPEKPDGVWRREALHISALGQCRAAADSGQTVDPGSKKRAGRPSKPTTTKNKRRRKLLNAIRSSHT